MATTKFKMPSDKQIWAEVDEQLGKISEAYKKLKGSLIGKKFLTIRKPFI